jgi:hypothetical protein
VLIPVAGLGGYRQLATVVTDRDLQTVEVEIDLDLNGRVGVDGALVTSSLVNSSAASISSEGI